MAGLQHEQFFTDGINTDISDSLISNKQARYLLNVRTANTDKDNVGSVEFVQGNELVSFPLPAGINRCIGQRKDDQFSIYYMVYNSLGYHCILRYRIDINVIIPVLVPQLFPVTIQTTFLNFQDDPRYRILSFDIVRDGDGNTIGYWTDGWVDDISLPYDRNLPPQQWSLKPFNRPRTLNFTLSENMYANVLPRYPFDLGFSNYDIQNQYTDRIKRPPYMGPVVAFRSDNTRNTNYLKGQPLPQFRYRYRYIDAAPSIWSPISEVALPFGDETLTNTNTFNNFVNNYVELRIDTGHASAIQIDLAVRFGNNGNWERFDTIDKYDLSQPDLFPTVVLEPSYTTILYRFYNDRIRAVIAEQDLINDNFVPIVSKNHVIVNDNRLIDGGIIEGYDAVKVDAEALAGTRAAILEKPVVSVIYPNRSTATPLSWEFGIMIVPATGLNIFFAPRFFNDVSVGTFINISFTFTVSGNPFTTIVITRNIEPSDLLTQNDYELFLARIIIEAQNRINDALNAASLTPVTLVPFRFPQEFVAVNGTRVYQLFPTIQPSASSPNYGITNSSIQAVSSITKVPSFKAGAHHRFSLIYMDEVGNRGGANTEERLTVYIPFPSENPQLRGIPYEITSTGLRPFGNLIYAGFSYDMNIIIRNTAPKWARKYIIAYAGSDIPYFVQFPLIAAPTFDTNGNVLINANSLIKFYIVDNNPTTVQYVYQDGDRIRFITNTNGDILSDYIDVRVLELREAGSDFFFVINPINFTGASIGSGSIAEVYRKRDTGSDSVFEFSRSFDVVYDSANDVWVHEGNNGNQSPTNPFGIPAQVALDRGDTYVKRRAYKNAAGPSVQLPIAIEAQQFSDFYPSSDFDFGRISLIQPDARQAFLYNELVHSDVFFEGTRVNGLSTVRSGSRTNVPLNNGKITRLVEVGFVLKVLQETNIVSVYIGRLQTFKADGTPDLIATNTVFGTKLPSESSMGTTFPGSVTRHDRHVYYFDALRGEVIRDSANGQFQISEYGKIADFRKLGLALIRLQNIAPQSVDIQSTFDENLGCYILTVIKINPDITDDIEGTWMFHEKSNSWRGNLSVIPEIWGGDKQYIMAFRNGQLWRMHSPNVPVMNFFGVQYRARITFVVNTRPNDVKVFDVVTLNSTTAWEFTNANGDMLISIPANDQYPQGMLSRLRKSMFKGKEGKWHTNFLRNAVSAGVGTAEQKLINGDTLRGYVMEITAESDATTQNTLFSIIVNCTPSNLSK